MFGKKLSANLSFWAVGLTYFVIMAFATVPSPLYVLYQERDGFNALVISIIFAAYAIGTLISLFTLGHLSDRFGRRRMILIALLVELVSVVLFLAGQGLAELIVARFVSGIATGMIAGTATAYLIELNTAARPEGGRARADLVSSVVVMAGLGSGALIGGLLAEYLPHPLIVPYVVFLGLLLAAVAFLWLSPETVTPPKEKPEYHVQRVSVPPAARTRFFAACGASLSLYAMLGLFSAAAPGFVAGTLGLHSHALAGLVTFVVFAGGALAPVVLARLSLAKILAYGFWIMAAGMVLVALGVWQVSFAVFLFGGFVTGVGAGLLFKGCVTSVASLAPPESRSETVVGLFLTGYIGLSIPVVLLGVASLELGAKTAVLGFTLLFLVLLVVVRRPLLKNLA